MVLMGAVAVCVSHPLQGLRLASNHPTEKEWEGMEHWGGKAHLSNDAQDRLGHTYLLQTAF